MGSGGVHPVSRSTLSRRITPPPRPRTWSGRTRTRPVLNEWMRMRTVRRVRAVRGNRLPSAVREREGLDARIEELDVELPVGDGTALTDQPVEPLLVEGAIALPVDVDAMCGAGRSPIDE